MFPKILYKEIGSNGKYGKKNKTEIFVEKSH